MRLQAGHVDHDRLGLGIHRCQPFHDPCEHTCFAPAFPPVVERPLGNARDRLVRTVGAERVASAEPVSVDEHDAARHQSIIDARLAVALQKERSQPRHLLVSQLKQIAHPRLLAEPESDRNAHINGP